MRLKTTVALLLLTTSSVILARAAEPDRNIPVPEARPDVAPPEKPNAAQQTAPTDEKTTSPDSSEVEAKAPPPEKEDPQAFAACISALKKTGIDFSEVDSFDDGNGCGIDKPVTVREVLPGIKLEPEAKMRCDTALQLSRWAKNTVLPAASAAFGPDRKITTLHQASSYVCRHRDSIKTAKLSEHAKGNAIDISGFTFSDKQTLKIEPRGKDSTLTGAFQRSIIAEGCLYFTTVLGPQSDSYHKTHIHLDVIKRHGGYRYCW